MIQISSQDAKFLGQAIAGCYGAKVKIPPYQRGASAVTQQLRGHLIINETQHLLKGTPQEKQLFAIIRKKQSMCVPKGHCINTKSDTRFLNKIGDVLRQNSPEVAKEKIISFITRVTEHLPKK